MQAPLDLNESMRKVEAVDLEDLCGFKRELVDWLHDAVLMAMLVFVSDEVERCFWQFKTSLGSTYTCMIPESIQLLKF